MMKHMKVTPTRGKFGLSREHFKLFDLNKNTKAIYLFQPPHNFLIKYFKTNLDPKAGRIL